MFGAAPVCTPPQRRGYFLSLLTAAALLTAGARGAAAQDGYAEVWSPKEEKASIHLHGGLFAPLDVDAPSPTVGLRLSKLVGSHLQAGVLTGWTLERKDLTQDTSTLPGPAPQLLLARVDAHVIPLMFFLRVNLTEKFFLVPYVGAGAGYEWLTLNAKDYRTEESRTTQYSNWAWEGWVGMGIRLGKQLRVNGEIFYNGASLEREVVDDNDKTWTEVVNLDGVGARAGLDIIF